MEFGITKKGGATMYIAEFNTPVTVNLIKCLAEIYLDSNGYSNIAGDLSNKSFESHGFSELQQYLNSKGVGPLFTTVQSFIKNKIIISSIADIIQEYIQTPRMKSIYKGLIKKQLGILTHIADSDIDAIAYSFSKAFLSSSLEKCPIQDGGYGKFIVNSFSNFYLRGETRKEVYTILNEKGTLLNMGSEDGINSLSLSELSTTVDTSINLPFSFSKDIERIYEASRAFYSGFKGLVFADIYDVYKSFVLDEKYKAISSLVKTYFYSKYTNSNTKSFLSDMSCFASVVVKNKLGLQSDYQLATYNKSKAVAAEFIKYINKRMSAKTVHSIYLTTLRICAGVENSKALKVVYYNSDPSNKDNQRIFYTLLQGFVSLRRLLVYCGNHGIDLNTLPSDIFRTDKYYTRFSTLEDCLGMYKVTSALISSADYTYKYNELCVHQSNDELFKWLQSVRSTSFTSIKDLISNQQQTHILEDTATIQENINRIINFRKVINIMHSTALTYKTFYKFESLEDAVLDGLDNPNYLQCLKLFLGKFRIGLPEINPSEDDMTLIENYYRYSRIASTLYHIIHRNLNTLLNQTDYMILRAIDAGICKILPSSITTLEEFTATLGKIDLGVSDDDFQVLLNPGFVYVLCNLYSLAYSKVKSIAEYTNSLIKAKIQDLSSMGIDTVETSYVSDVLHDSSILIYNTVNEPCNHPVFLRLRTRCREVNSYLYVDSAPLIYRGCYVHVMGRLVSPEGDVVSLDADFFKYFE